jgi:predicted nucleotidyltransferase
MNKATKYTINLAIAGAVGNALLNIFSQRNKNTNTKIDWERVLIASGKGALWGGAAGLVIGALEDEKLDEALHVAGGTSAFLYQTLESYENYDTTLENKANKIQMLLYQKFKYLLVAPPKISGSKYRGTSIAGSDIDIQVKFKRNAGSIDEVRNLIEDFFTEKFEDARLIKVRSQPCSIGLLFRMYGKECRIDIVPMRAVGNSKGDAFLCVKENSIFRKDTITKTNSGLQSKSLKFTDKQRRIIKLLKGWKKLNDIELPSIYIELIVKRACDKITLPKGLLRSVLSVVEYIGNNVRTIRIIDPANSNNIISEYLTPNEKISIQKYCYKMIKDIKEDERNIVEYFPSM